jgi:hypothetical protein
MRASAFDILKKLRDGSFFWLEAARDIESAKARMGELGARSPGEYVLFDQTAQRIVAVLANGIIEDI